MFEFLFEVLFDVLICLSGSLLYTTGQSIRKRLETKVRFAG
jgi:hypothetical protein